MANITLVLNDAEQQALNRLFDSALRQAGLNALDVVSHFVGRILTAQEAAVQPQGASPKETQIQTAVPVPPAPTNSTAANPTPSASMQHQSILSHLIGEITGGAQSPSGTHATASEGTAPANEPSLSATRPEAPGQTIQSAAASAPATSR